MSHKTFKLTLRSPDQTLFDADAVSIKFRAENGQMQVFAHHASITASILFSTAVIETPDGSEEKFIVRRGVFAFNNTTNEANLLANFAEIESEMDTTTAQSYLEFIEAELAKGSDLSKFQLTYLENEKLAVQKQLS